MNARKHSNPTPGAPPESPAVRPPRVLRVDAAEKVWRLPPVALNNNVDGRALRVACRGSERPPRVHLGPVPRFDEKDRVEVLRFASKLKGARFVVGGQEYDDLFEALFAFLLGPPGPHRATEVLAVVADALALLEPEGAD